MATKKKIKAVESVKTDELRTSSNGFQFALAKVTSRKRRRLVPTAYSPISKIPGVCGGKPCVTGTRIPVWGLERARRRGLTEFEILKRYPSLSLDGLRAAWEYIAAHQKEIEKQIRANEKA